MRDVSLAAPRGFCAAVCPRGGPSSASDAPACQGVIEAVSNTLELENERFREIMTAEQEQFQKDVDKLQRTVATFSKHTDLNQV